MSRNNRKKIAQKIAEEIKRAINNNRFKINGRFYLLTSGPDEYPWKILEELRKKGYSSAYEILKKVFLETRTGRSVLKKSSRQRQFLPSANYLF
jgi:hypothetical protein